MGNKISNGKNPKYQDANPNDPGLGIKTQSGRESQLMKKDNQQEIGKGKYGSIYKQNNNFVRKVPLLNRGEGIVSAIIKLKELQQDFQTINSQRQTSENIWSVFVAQNEINNYKYISKRDEIKEYFPLFIKNIGIVSYIEFLEGYITFREFLQNSENTDEKKQLMKDIVEILKKIHSNGFYHRDLYSLENIMIKKDKDTKNIKFIDLGLSLNTETIENYSNNKLQKILNTIHKNRVGEAYNFFVNTYLQDNSTDVIPKEELPTLLANKDLIMFLVSCQILLFKNKKISEGDNSIITKGNNCIYYLTTGIHSISLLNMNDIIENKFVF